MNKNQASIISFFKKPVQAPAPRNNVDQDEPSEILNPDDSPSVQESGDSSEPSGSCVDRRTNDKSWLNKREIMSISEICQKVDKWYDPNYADNETGNRSTVLGRKQILPATFLHSYG